MAKVKDIYEFINSIAPFDSQMPWDNSGLILGDMNREVTKIGVVLDATDENIEDAVKQGCDLLVTHHPIIFHAVKAIDFTSPVAVAIKYSLPVISAHTNLDIADKGVNFALANKLGLKDIQNHCSGDLMLWSGKIDKMTPEEFAAYIGKKLDGAVTYESAGKDIEKVAICGGSAGEFYANAAQMGFDAFVSGEMHYNEYLDAKRAGISVFIAGHYETENPVIELFADMIKEGTGVDCVALNWKKPYINA